jgi:hypothetical protein
VAIDSRFAVVERFPFTPGRRCACYECGLPPAAYTAISARYSCGWLKRVAITERKIPTTILTSSTAAALAVSLHLRPARDGDDSRAWRHFQDSFTGLTTRTEIAQLEGCPGCGDLLDRRLIVSARRRVEHRLEVVASGDEPLNVLFSDRVLTHVRCSRCAPGGASSVVFDRADRYDERLITCPDCGDRAREIGLRDQFTLEDLVRGYAGRDIPGKFVMATLGGDLQVVVELKGA